MTALVQRIRVMRGLHWLMLFALILLAWIVLYAMSLPADLRAASKLYGAEFWTELCTVTPDAAGFARVLLMWVLMSAAFAALIAYVLFGKTSTQTPAFMSKATPFLERTQSIFEASQTSLQSFVGQFEI